MKELHFVCDGPPSHESGRFVELEDETGKGALLGSWEQRGQFWHLIVAVHNQALGDVADERARQDAKGGEQNHPDLIDDEEHRKRRPGLEAATKAACDKAFKDGRGTWEHIAFEELAEVLNAPDTEARRVELVQLAAVCVAWIECIDRRLAK